MNAQILKCSMMSLPISMLMHLSITDRKDYWPNSEGLTEITETKVKTLGCNSHHNLPTVLLARTQKGFGLTQRESLMIDSTHTTVIVANWGLGCAQSITRTVLKLVVIFIKWIVHSQMNVKVMLSFFPVPYFNISPLGFCCIMIHVVKRGKQIKLIWRRRAQVWHFCSTYHFHEVMESF